MVVDILILSVALIFTGAACFYGLVCFWDPERIDRMWTHLSGKIKRATRGHQSLEAFSDVVALLPSSIRRQLFPYWKESNFGLLRLVGLITFVGMSLLFLGVLAAIVVTITGEPLH